MRRRPTKTGHGQPFDPIAEDTISQRVEKKASGPRGIVDRFGRRTVRHTGVILSVPVRTGSPLASEIQRPLRDCATCRLPLKREKKKCARKHIKRHAVAHQKQGKGKLSLRHVARAILDDARALAGFDAERVRLLLF